ncbi:MAG: HPP family protein [Gammaproteobacteria bacterium]|nr:HPP family protein [Gammaproteobacteria bacterium]
MFKFLINIFGIDLQAVSHKERIISGIGAFLGIFFVYITCQHFVDTQGSIFILASMGSSAVLLFAVPHGSLSQPWPLLGGHVLSALVGVTCVNVFENHLLAASVAVGLAVTVMYYARCTHPPGGATALGAVLGGPSVHELGYQFVITPVLLNTIIILLVAIAFNALFNWRRYPVYVDTIKNKSSNKALKPERTSLSPISHEGFVYALSQIDTFIDVDESDLVRIYELATSKKQATHQEGMLLKLNGFYSNGEYGNQWSVRQILNINENETVNFKTVAGTGRRKKGTSTISDFMKWARYEVYRDEDNWFRVS